MCQTIDLGNVYAVRGEVMSRCKSCEKIFDERDLRQPAKADGSAEDLCFKCNAIVFGTLHAEEPPTDWDFSVDVSEDEIHQVADPHNELEELTFDI